MNVFMPEKWYKLSIPPLPLILKIGSPYSGSCLAKWVKIPG
jgi:hypothetical protein